MPAALLLLLLLFLLPPLLRNMPCNCSISCISNFPGTNPSVSLLHSLFMSTRRLLDCILQAGQTQKGAPSILHRGKFQKVRRWQASLASCLVFVCLYLCIRICVFVFVFWTQVQGWWSIDGVVTREWVWSELLGRLSAAIRFAIAAITRAWPSAGRQRCLGLKRGWCCWNWGVLCCLEWLGG